MLMSFMKEAALNKRLDARPTKKAPTTTLVFLVLFEGVVMSKREPKFIRMFAWYRLVRYWSSMRFDDHRGMLPSCFV